MYNPHTVEQYHIYSYLKEKFYLEYCLLSPLSRSSMLIEDMAGAARQHLAMKTALSGKSHFHRLLTPNRLRLF